MIKVLKTQLLNMSRRILNRLLYYWLLLFFMFQACQPGPEGYERIGSDIYFKLLRFGEYDHRAHTGDYMTLRLEYRTMSDSLFFQGKRKFRLDASPDPGALSYVLMRLSEEDSAAVVISPESFFKHNLQRDVPSFLAEENFFIINLKVTDIQSAEEFQREKDLFLSWVAEFKQSETERIEGFMNEEELDFSSTSSGLYFLPLNEGNGKKVKDGDHVFVHYEGRFLDGRFVDNTKLRNEPVDFIYGREYALVAGLEEAVGMMREGQQALVILPSGLAFGHSGSGGGIVPPYTALVYEIELLKIEHSR